MQLYSIPPIEVAQKPTFHKYSELPTELRHQVIYEALSEDYELSDILEKFTSIPDKKYIVLTRTHFPTDIAPFLLASKFVRQDALQVFALTPIRIYHRLYSLLHYLQLMHAGGVLDKVHIIGLVLTCPFTKQDAQYAIQIANLLTLAPRIKVYLTWENAFKDNTTMEFPRRTMGKVDGIFQWQYDDDKASAIRRILPLWRQIGLMLREKSCKIGGREYRFEDVPVGCLDCPVETEIFLSHVYEVVFVDDCLRLYMLGDEEREYYLRGLDKFLLQDEEGDGVVEMGELD